MALRSIVIFTLFLFQTLTASAQFGDITKRLGIGKTTDLSDSKIASGLKEALQVGAGNAVKLTGQPDGYFKNEAIKILMPKNLKMLDTGLRAVGVQALQVDISRSGRKEKHFDHLIDQTMFALPGP